MGKRFFWPALATLCWLGISIGSLWPRGVSLGASDKLTHALSYALFTSLLLAAVWPRWRLAAALALGWGAVIEVLQTQVPGRSGEWLDLLANASGVVLVLLLQPLLCRVYRRLFSTTRLKSS